MEENGDNASASITPSAAVLLGASHGFSPLVLIRSFATNSWWLNDNCLARKVGAEFIGTMILVFTGSTAAIMEDQSGGAVTLVGLALCGGLGVTLLISTTAHISGAHLNPSITISFALLRHFPWRQVPIYLGAQMAASLAAAFLLKGIFHSNIDAAATVPLGSTTTAFVMEFIIGFNLMFVATAMATDARAAARELAAVAVGATVAVNVLIAGRISGASMNPARTFGPAIVTNNYNALWVYFTAPVLGAIAGAGIYTAIKLPEDRNFQNRPLLSEA